MKTFDTRLLHYILDSEGEPMVVDLMTWADWFEHNHQARVVFQDQMSRGVVVSTVFLGLDHNFFGDGPPILWETMIFNGPFDGYQRRYRSRLDALVGHQVAIALVQLYRAVPRKTKKVLRKWGSNAWPSPPICPRERRRLVRALHKVES